MLVKLGKINLLFFALMLSFILLGSSARAHVVIKDQTNTYNSILHITPDDDPIAGKISQLFFDIQGLKIKEDSQPTLEIKGDNAHDIIDTKVDKNFVSADYTFKNTGLYKLKLTIESADDEAFIFEYSQRIVRGEGAEGLDARHAWAEIIMVAASTGLLVLATVAFSKRKRILDKNK